MPKPTKRVRVKIITDGLSPKTAKKVQSFLARAIGDEMKKTSVAGPHSGFPKQGTIVASGFGKHVGISARRGRTSSGK